MRCPAERTVGGKEVFLMKPAGRERDIEIAKLKGLNPKTVQQLIDEKIFASHMINSTTDIWIFVKHPVIYNRKYWIFCPHYSTNRNDAWELWDELRKKKITLNFSEAKNDKESILIVWLKSGKTIPSIRENTLIIIGKDFADCVSQAWIKWKENQTTRCVIK